MKRSIFSTAIDIVLAMVIATGAWHVGREVARAVDKINSPFNAAASELRGR